MENIMMNEGFNAVQVTKNFYTDSIAPSKRGKAISVKDYFGSKVADSLIDNVKVHDANFAFLSTTLAKLDPTLYKPLHWVTYAQDVQIDVGGGFVDYVTQYSVDWAGIMNEFRNVVGNNANYIPRVNAGLSKKQVNVYTWEVAYDLRFIELEKMKKVEVSQSINTIYEEAILAGWDLFAQKVAYTGVQGQYGLFNSPNVMTTTIDNSATTGSGFDGLTDDEVASFFNGVFELYMINSLNNISILPDTFLLPTFVGADLSTRMSELYNNSLRNYLVNHNLAVDESDGEVKVSFRSRPQLNSLGTAGKGRIVAYKNDKNYVKLDVPHPIQHFITLPNIDKMSYTTAFAGQISAIQMPYNNSASEFGVVSYWDFTD